MGPAWCPAMSRAICVVLDSALTCGVRRKWAGASPGVSSAPAESPARTTGQTPPPRRAVVVMVCGPGQAGHRGSGARTWRSRSEASWLEIPSRARSTSRVIGCPWAAWCSAAARRAEASSVGPVSVRDSRPAGDGPLGLSSWPGTARRTGPAGSGACLCWRGCWRGVPAWTPRPGTPRTGWRPSPAPTRSAAPGPGSPPGSPVPRPQGPRPATTAARWLGRGACHAGVRGQP